MRLRAADIERIIDSTIHTPQNADTPSPKSDGGPSVDVDQELKSTTVSFTPAQQELLAGLSSKKNTSSPRVGEKLPRLHATPGVMSYPPPPEGHVVIDGELIAEEDVDYSKLRPRPTALLGVDLNQVETRADLIRVLTPNLPLNDLQLPRILYRGDLLDVSLFRGEPSIKSDPSDRYQAMQDFLNAATLHLQYDEGFPALKDGTPLWARLPFETQPQFAAFTDYCTLSGARQLAKLSAYDQAQLREWYHEYYWAIRVRCYDMLSTIHAAKQREDRIMSSENRHFIVMDNALTKLEEIMTKADFSVLEKDPEKLVATLGKVVTLQRQILNLNTKERDRETKVESLDVTMRRIATPPELAVREDDTVSIREALSTPEALASAQELIIRLTRTHHGSVQTSEEDDSDQ